MKKLLKNILVTFLSTIVTIVMVYGGYTIYAQEDYTFEDAGFFDLTMSLYHAGMNSYFNERMAKLVDFLEDDEINPFEDEKFKAPESYEDCDEDNVSSFCVAVFALDIYIAYVEKLESLKSIVETRTEEQLEASGEDYLIFENSALLFGYTSEKNQKIDEEIVDAKMVMEATVAAYNEFRLAYPLHKEYHKTITNLAFYQRYLTKVYRQAREFPLRFIDSTSSQCN